MPISNISRSMNHVNLILWPLAMAIIISSTWKHLPDGFKKSWSIWNRCKNALGIRYNGPRCCFITPPNMGSYHRGGNGAHLLRRYCLCLCLRTVSIITHHTWVSGSPTHTAESVGESCGKDYYCLGHWQLAWGGMGSQLFRTILFVFVLLSLSWSGFPRPTINGQLS